MSDPNEMPTVARDSDSVRGFLVARFDGGVEMGPDLPQGAWSRAYAFRHARVCGAKTPSTASGALTAPR